MLLWPFYEHPVDLLIEQSNAFNIKLHLRSKTGNVCLFLAYRKLLHIWGGVVFNGEE